MATETENTRLESRRGFSLRIPSIVGSGLWALSAKLVSQVAQLAAFVIAAHVLTPAEFGFFAFSSAVAVLLVVLAEGGWAEFVMKSADDEHRLDQVASIATASGLLFTAFGLAAAGILDSFTQMRWEASLLALFSLWILPAAMTTIYDGVLVHRGELHKQAMIRIVAEAGGLAVVAFGLWAGWNVFALVAGRLAMQLLILFGSVAVVGWVPPVRPTRPVLRDVLQFSRHIIANRLILFFRSYSGTLAVGSFLGLSEAGYYRAAERIVAAFYELIGEPARMLAWIVFRRARDSRQTEGDAVRQAGNALVPLLLAVAVPVFLGLALVSGSFVEIVLGEVWAPAAVVVSILSIKQLLLISSSVTEPLLSIRGTISKMAQVGVVNTIIFVSFVILLAPFGLLAVALGQILAACIAFTMIVWLQGRYGGIDWLSIAGNSGFVLFAAAGMVAAVLAVGYADVSALHPVVELALRVLAGALGYLLVLVLMKRLFPDAIPFSASGHKAFSGLAGDTVTTDIREAGTR